MNHQRVKLKSFHGTVKPVVHTSENENYWKLIGEKGEIIDSKSDSHLLILFEKNLDDFQLENHNPIKNSLWIRVTDLETENGCQTV